MQLPSISLIIPCYNEQVRIPQFEKGIKSFLISWQNDFEIILVNDGSTDQTFEIIAQNEFFKPLILSKKIILISQQNTGKGGALANGVSIATKDYCLTLDFDMATCPTEVINWYKINPAIFDNNIVIASRELPESKLILISARRKQGNLFNLITRTILKLPFHDTQCGFKLYPTAIAKDIFKDLKIIGWAHDIELLLRAKNKKHSIVEMPITWNERDASKVNVLKDGLIMLKDVLKLRFLYK